jgi:hypothetical protein
VDAVPAEPLIHDADPKSGPAPEDVLLETAEHDDSALHQVIPLADSPPESAPPPAPPESNPPLISTDTPESELVNHLTESPGDSTPSDSGSTEEPDIPSEDDAILSGDVDQAEELVKELFSAELVKEEQTKPASRSRKKN